VKQHERQDPAALLEALRQAERRGEYSEALGVLAALVDCGEWRACWDAGERWMVGGRQRQIVTPGDSLTVEIVPGSRIMAARAANAFRLLAPVAGHAVPSKERLVITRDVSQSHPGYVVPVLRSGVGIVPNPLPRYVEALRLWRPDGWLAWLALWLDGASTRAALRPDGDLVYCVDQVFIQGGDCVDGDGSVDCGTTCPALPEVPMGHE